MKNLSFDRHDETSGWIAWDRSEDVPIRVRYVLRDFSVSLFPGNWGAPTDAEWKVVEREVVKRWPERFLT